MRTPVKATAARRGVQRPAASKKASPGVKPPRKVERARLRLDVDARRTQLVELGLAEFTSRAYEDVSIDRIAHAARISKGLLYHYFPTKRAFYVACVREASSRLLARLELPPGLPALDQLNERVARYLEFARLHGGAFATLMRNRAGGVDRELATAIDEARAEVLAYLTSGLGDVLPDAPPLPLVQIALHGWIGFAEAASVAWVESCVAKSENIAKATEVRDMLVHALISILRRAVSLPKEPSAS